MSAMPELMSQGRKSLAAMPDTGSQPVTKVLIQIWQSLLRLPNVDINANFFDLGGDSALAVELFAKIADACGQQLPPVMIYHVPTIAAQAALLQQQSTPELSPLIMLKSGERDS